MFPDNCTVVGIPGRVVVRNGQNIANKTFSEIALQHNQLPDPVNEMFLAIERQIQRLDSRIEDLEGEKKDGH